jgi:SAM-dependent methyltransferase
VKRGFRVTAYSLEDPPNIFATLSVSERERLTFIRGEPGETRRLPFESGAFTAAFSVGVLEHVQERDGDELTSLLELNRVLTDDGVFICYHLPNRYSYIEALSRCYGRPFFHRYRFTARDIRNLCLKAGLSVVESGRYGFLPRNPLSRLPDRICNSPVMAVAINRGDAVLERLLSPIVQNYYFVARLGPKGSSANIRALA